MLRCQFCGRSDFKSSKGYQQHLRNNQSCRRAQEATFSQSIEQEVGEEEAWTRKIIEDNAKRLALAKGVGILDDTTVQKLMQHDLEFPASAQVQYQLSNVFDLEAADQDGSSEENSEQSATEGFDLPSDQSDESDPENESQNDESDQEEMDDQANVNKNAPSARGVDGFVEFCRENPFFAPLAEAEECGIRLMDVLRNKKAPINACNGLITGRNFYLADTDAIVSPCAVIPDIGGPPNRYYMVKSRREWHKDFISWVRRPHEEDDMNEVLDDENDE